MGSAGWGGTPQTVRHFASAMLKADAVALLEHLEPSTDAAPGRARVLRVYRGPLEAGAIIRFAHQGDRVCPPAPAPGQAGQRDFGILRKVTAGPGVRVATDAEVYRIGFLSLDRPWPDALPAYELAVAQMGELERAADWRARVAATRPLLRNPHPLAQVVGLELLSGDEALQVNVRSDVLALVAEHSDEAVAMEAASATWTSLKDRHAGWTRVDPTVTLEMAAARLAWDPIFREFVDRVVALMTAPNSSHRLRRWSCVWLAEARSLLEVGQFYASTGLPGEPEETRKAVHRASCRARGLEIMACDARWWCDIEAEAMARWRAWHAAGGHLQARPGPRVDDGGHSPTTPDSAR